MVTATYVNEFGASQRHRRLAVLHPVNHTQEHVVLRIQSRVRSSQSSLPYLPSADAAGTVAHTAYAEEAVEFVETAGGKTHGGHDVVVVPRRVLRGDDGISLSRLYQLVDS